MAHTDEGRAFGKVILLGEHVVVYGVPALAVGIDRGARASAEALPGALSTLRVEGPGFGADAREDGDDDLARAFRALLEIARASKAVQGAVAVTARAELPAGAGLGCSAALGVAVTRALDPRADNAAVRHNASAWERVFHGKPSGIDAAVATQGGCLYFERVDQGEKLSPLLVPEPGLLLAVGHSGVASSTKSMVEAVARLRERRPDMVEKTFDGARSLVENARLALEQGDVSALGRLMDLNQMLLGGLMVSTPEIETLCALAREHGALGAKLTGAGGGGCVVALVASQEVGDAVVAAWAAAGFRGFTTRALGNARPAAPTTPLS